MRYREPHEENAGVRARDHLPVAHEAACTAAPGVRSPGNRLSHAEHACQRAASVTLARRTSRRLRDRRVRRSRRSRRGLSRAAALPRRSTCRAEDPSARRLRCRSRRALRAGGRARGDVAPLAEVHGFGDDEKRGFLFDAIRLVEGPALDAVFPRLAASPAVARTSEWRRRAVVCVANLADALPALHRAGVVHWDVKPSNILLDGCQA